jgi:hypothetical protein
MKPSRFTEEQTCVSSPHQEPFMSDSACVQYPPLIYQEDAQLTQLAD